MFPPVDELQLTKKRLQNLRRKSFGLQQLAVRVISKHLTFYRAHPDELEKLKGLPSLLREKILQVLMKKRCLDVQGQETEFVNLKEIFPFLLSARTRYIELNGILSFCPDRYKDRKIEKVTQWCVELLKQIETRAPQVETLVINRNNTFDTEGIYFRYAVFNQDMVQSLMKMQKLNRLNVNLYSINFLDLLKICTNLLSLQYMNIDLSFPIRFQDMPTTEEVLSSFSNLKEFIFENPCVEWLGCLCTRNLPNIEVVQFDPNKVMIRTVVRTNGNRYQGLDYPGASNMRHVIVDYVDKAKEVEAMPKLFPKVTCLVIANTGCLEEDMMPKYNNIRQLHLRNVYGSVINEHYLITYGQKLHSIYLGNDFENSTINLESVFKFCPKLEKLSLLNVCLNNWPSPKMEFFAELKELEWLFHFYDSSSFGRSGRPDLQIMLLSNILSAPKLEKVKLEVKLLNDSDLSILNSLIQEKRILKNLHTLHVYFNFAIPEAFANFLKSACAFLPKLTDFKFGRRYKFEDPLLTIQSTILNDVDASVSEMNAVFDNEN